MLFLLKRTYFRFLRWLNHTLVSARIPFQKPTPPYGFLTIQSFSKTSGQEDEDGLLCQVSALKFYLNRVKSIQGSRKRLNSFKVGGGGGARCVLLSLVGWPQLKKGIFLSLTLKDISFFKIRPHDLRA